MCLVCFILYNIAYKQREMKYTSMRILYKQRKALEFIKIMTGGKNLQITLSVMITGELLNHIHKAAADPYLHLVNSWYEADQDTDQKQDNQLELFSEDSDNLQT